MPDRSADDTGMSAGKQFYSTSALRSLRSLRSPFSRADVLAGRVIKINPALITITDGRLADTPAAELQRLVLAHAGSLLDHGVRTFHVDVNYDDYSHFASSAPDINAEVFSPAFLSDLSGLIAPRGAYLNLHVLTDNPSARLRAMRRAGVGAMCFQLDVLTDAGSVEALVREIEDMGACASPVIELVGTERHAPRARDEVLRLLEPSLPRIGLLTIQATGTASRSDSKTGRLQGDAVAGGVRFYRDRFAGPIQLQGGVTTATIGTVVRWGAEFLVCGTEIFRNKDGRSPGDVVRGLLEAAADALAPLQAVK